MPVTILVLGAPMLFTSRSYASDWPNHLWLVWQQSLNIKELGHPSYFVQSDFGAFYPWFAFNGGTLYTTAGLIAWATGGHPLAAYIFTYIASFSAAYGGWWWLTTQVGLGGWRAHLPAILFVTSSFYVSNIYGRGDFPEEVGTSAVPLTVAGGVWLLRSPRWRPLPLLGFLLGVVYLTGSHTITVLWGGTFLAITAVAVALALRGSWLPTLRRCAAVGAVAVLGILVNSWYLALAFLYQSKLLINNEYPGISEVWYTKTSQLFGVLRDAKQLAISGYIQAQLPTLAILWAIIVGLAAWRWMDGLLRKLLLATAAVLAFFVWVILAPNILARLGPWQHVEYPYRLVTYGSLAACGMALVGMLAIERCPSALRRGALSALVLVTAVSVALGIREMWKTPSFLPGGRDQAFASISAPPSATWYYGRDYSDRSLPVVRPTIGGDPPNGEPGIVFAASPETTKYSYRLVVSKPGLAVSNLAAGPYMLRITGATVAGRDPYGLLVLRIIGRPGQHKVITVHSATIRGAIALTLVALVGCLALLATVAVRSRRPRGGTPREAGAAVAS